jgi:hypothetical protein
VKYARIERERRFLLDGLPDLAGARVLRITDRYVDGTRLRVRTVEEDGCDVVRKLGQKIPTDDVHASGLVLAETEGTGEPPFPYVREVTDDVEFTGAWLAGARGAAG